jgi:hypothetical protein
MGMSDQYPRDVAWLLLFGVLLILIYVACFRHVKCHPFGNRRRPRLASLDASGLGEPAMPVENQI